MFQFENAFVKILRCLVNIEGVLVNCKGGVYEQQMSITEPQVGWECQRQLTRQQFFVYLFFYFFNSEGTLFVLLLTRQFADVWHARFLMSMLTEGTFRCLIMPDGHREKYRTPETGLVYLGYSILNNMTWFYFSVLFFLFDLFFNSNCYDI